MNRQTYMVSTEAGAPLLATADLIRAMREARRLYSGEPLHVARLRDGIILAVVGRGTWSAQRKNVERQKESRP